MSGDYSRVRFDPSNNFSGVLMQQGRVQLDSDWNEWVAASDRRMRAESIDSLSAISPPGTGGVAMVSPQTPGAFELVVKDGTLIIGRGRMYVDGLVAENHGNKDGPPSFDPVLAELQWPDTLPYNKQPYFPSSPDLSKIEPGQYLAYLEVWQRELTHLQQTELVEPALGVDTTARLQTVWQVRFLPGGEGQTYSCCPPDGYVKEWNDLTLPTGGRLSTRTVDVGTNTDPCDLPPSGGYRGSENQLYRIQIHEGGGPGTATFKWSRDNATVATNVVGIVAHNIADHNNTTTTLNLASLGRDAVLRFKNGDWVEVLDDCRELSGEGKDARKRRGKMCRIITVDETAQTVTCTPALTTPDLLPVLDGADVATKLAELHTRVIRWDGDGEIDVPSDGRWIDLEDGIQVKFSLDSEDKKEFHCGDYWVAAARTADASIELLDKEPPRGAHRHYAPLAMVTFGEDKSINVHDCRMHRAKLPHPASGGCCTVTISPSDLTRDTTLKQIVERYSQNSTVHNTVLCLLPGNYCLTEPLRLGSDHSGLTLKGCKGAVFCVSKDSEADFSDGMVVIDDAEDITLCGIGFVIPQVRFAMSSFAGLPLHSLDPSMRQAIEKLFVSIGVRAVNSRSLTIENCQFSFQPLNSKEFFFGVGVLESGRCTGLRLEGNKFKGSASSPGKPIFQAGYMLVSATAFIRASESQPTQTSLNSANIATTNPIVHNQPTNTNENKADPIRRHDAPEAAEGESPVTDQFLLRQLATAQRMVIAQSYREHIERIGTAEPPALAPALAPNGGAVLTAALSEAAFKDNSFLELTAAVLVVADVGAAKVIGNDVTGGAGFLFLSPQLMDLVLSDFSILFGCALALGYPLPAAISRPTDIGPAIAPIRICTAKSEVTDSHGNVWTPDIQAKTVSVTADPSASSLEKTCDSIGATEEQRLYQSERHGIFSYTFNKLPVGYYQVTLKFAETFRTFSGTGGRVFSVSINGKVVLKDFDIVKAAGGQYIAVDRVFSNIVPEEGKITIQFIHNVADPKISAVEIASHLYQASSNEIQNFLTQLKTLTQQAYAGMEAQPLKLRVDNNNVDHATSIAMLVADFPQGPEPSLMTMNGNIFRRTSGPSTLAGATAGIGWVNIFTATGNQILNTTDRGYSAVFLGSGEHPNVAIAGNAFQGTKAVLP